MVAELIGENLETTRVAVELGMPTTIPVKLGNYLVRASLPGGAVGQVKVAVGDVGTSLDVVAPAPIAPDPGRAVSIGPVSAVDRFSSQLPEPKPDRRTRTRSGSAPPWTTLGTWHGVWTRVWRKESVGWEASYLEPVEDEISEWSLGYVFDVDDGLHVVQVGGSDLAWRCVALPERRALLTMVVRWETGSPELVISARPEDSQRASLLDYLTEGDLRSAGLLGEELVNELAEEMLHGKFEHPLLAALGGYVLLETGDVERLHDWPNNIAEYIDWLPDGPVILAWQLLRQASPGAMSDARAALLQAASLGVPAFTKGLRLLWDGLRIFGEDDPDDTEITEAIDGLRSYAIAADWTAPTTTYGGEEPSTPSRRPSRGIPEGDDIWFVR